MNSTGKLIATMLLLICSLTAGTASSDDNVKIAICNPDWDGIELQVTRGPDSQCDQNEAVYSGRIDRGRCVRVRCDRGNGEQVCWRSRATDGAHNWPAWKHDNCAFHEDYDL